MTQTPQFQIFHVFFTLIQPIGQVENSKNVSYLFDLLDFNCYLQQREKEKKK